MFDELSIDFNVLFLDRETRLPVYRPPVRVAITCAWVTILGDGISSFIVDSASELQINDTFSNRLGTYLVRLKRMILIRENNDR